MMEAPELTTLNPAGPDADPPIPGEMIRKVSPTPKAAQSLATLSGLTGQYWQAMGAMLLMAIHSIGSKRLFSSRGL